MSQSPKDILNSIRAKAKLNTDADFSKQVAIKLNKEGKLKLQLLAPDSEHLFVSRTQHFIPKIPYSDDANQKGIVCDCLGEGCPVCSAVTSFIHSGIELSTVNDVYKNKYEYRTLKSVFTQPEHFLVAARVLRDQTDGDVSFLPKDEEVGSIQLIQFSKSALNSLMQSYEDFLEDMSDTLNVDDENNLAPLFGTVSDAENGIIKSLTVNLRVNVTPYAYTFSFGSGIEVDTKTVSSSEKIELLKEGLQKPAEDYIERAVKRVKDITAAFTGKSIESTSNTANSNELPFTIGVENTTSSKDDDFELDIDL